MINAVAGPWRPARRRAWPLWVAAVVAFGIAAQESHLVPLFPANEANKESAGTGQESAQGFLRVVNHSAESGEVRIVGFDEAGARSRPVTLALAAGAAAHINSEDFEHGNPGKGLSGGVGPPGAGDWWLTLASSLDVEVNAYIRAADGFLTSMHDVAAEQGAAHRVPFFNPASNVHQRSRLRLINPADRPARVVIRGVDDHGRHAGPVRATVPAGGARTITAQALEAGGDDLVGALGDGAGKWRLTVVANGPLHVLSALRSPTGHITNLSSAPAAATARVHHVPLFPAASRPNQGFLRIVNPGPARTVRITAIDDGGGRRPPVTLAIGAGRTAHLNSADLERGNPRKGLSGGVGDGVGDWRLLVGPAPATASANVPAVRVLAYVRGQDGFVTSMHDVAPAAGRRHRVTIFNPGDNIVRESVLRVVNMGAAPATVMVAGTSDDGAAGGEVAFVIPAEGARSFSARALEIGGDGLVGALGDGAGKWRLDVTGTQPIVVMSLLRRANGPLANLSTTTRETAAAIFRATLAGPVVRGDCVSCHVAGGAAGGTRLVFETDAEHGHDERNQRALEGFLAGVADAARLVLDKAAGLRGHGGGARLHRASTAYADLDRFLARAAAERPGARVPGEARALLDAIPSAGGLVGPGAAHIDLVHTAPPGHVYAYSGACPIGVALRRTLAPAADGAPRQLVDHKLQCRLEPLSHHRVRVDGRNPDGVGVESALTFATGDDWSAAALTVRDARTIARDSVNELFDRYIEATLIEDIDSRTLQLLAAVLIDQLARRTWAELRSPGARYDVVTESVSYASRSPAGAPTTAVTGLIARPDVSAAPDFTAKRRVVVLSHATGATPSALEFEDAWYALASMLAGRGYLVVVPDNWGRGELAVAGQPETYLLVNRSANNSVDLLKAVLANDAYRAFHDAAQNRTDVSIVGYSQGGHTALALWVALHTGDHGVTVRELFSGAGPHNLLGTFRGAVQRFAGRCDGNEWCRHVDRAVVLPYVVGRILPALLAYTDTGLAASDVIDGRNLRPEFMTGFLAGDARYDALRTLLALNSFTNVAVPANAIRGGTAINLYHSKYDRLVPAANTRELATALLGAGFDVTHHDRECSTGAYESLFELVDRVGVLHVVCGMEVLDDVLKRFP